MRFVETEGFAYIWDGEKCKGQWCRSSKRVVYHNSENSVELFECNDISQFKTFIYRKELKRKIQKAQEELESTVNSLLESYKGRTFNQAFFDAEAKALDAYVKAHEEAWAEHVKSYSE